MNLKLLVYEGVVWSYVAQVRYHWSVHFNTVKKILVP